MAAMTDPMNALKLFQGSFARGQIPVEQGRIDPTLLFAPDSPNDKVRFNYMRAEGKTLTTLVMFAHSGMIDGQPCFNIGYAVAEAFRGRGLAKSTLVAALDELANGLTGARIPSIHVEAVISPENIISQRVASVIFDEAPTSITDSESGLPALHYIRRIDLPMRRG
jgi:GNAT superfamily N-acetyltransferase